MTVRSGQTLSHYRLVEKIGEGGMGVVWKAEDTLLGRTVAIKVLPPDAARDDARRRLFLQEARLASSLSHAHIAQVHDLGREEGLDFIVMEYVEGKPLNRILHGRPLPPDKVAGLGVQVAQALARAHRKGLLHRDLKPGNILVTPEGDVKVVDFGLATLMGPRDTTRLSEMSTAAPGAGPQGDAGSVDNVIWRPLVGTLPYMSPEQARGETLDTRSDIFSLGTVLYEMTTGQRPFAGATTGALLEEVVKARPKPPHEIVPKLPLELGRIIQKGLAPGRADRYQTMEDLAVDLKRLARDLETGSSPSYGDLKGVSAPSRRRRLWIVTASLVAAMAGVVAALLLGLNVDQWRERLLRGAAPQRIESLAVLPLVNLSHDPEQEFFADGMTEALITNLARIGALKVISRTSVMQYKGARKPLPEIGRELDVDAVVEGSVLYSGERVRITAQLIQVETDRHLWADSYDRDLSDVLSLQTEVAQAIAQEIRVKVTPEERRLLVSSRRVNPEAQEHYLKGRYYWNKRTEDGIRKGIEYFTRAIEKEPDNGPAYAGLADSYIVLSSFEYLSPKDGYPKAKAAATKALAIDDTLAEAHCSLALVMFYHDWDWRAAEREFKRSIQLKPSYQTAHHWFAVYLALMGRFDEARLQFRRAQELDPLSLIISAEAGFPALYARQYDEAIMEFQKAIQMDPYFPPAHAFLGLAYEQAGRIPEALGEFEKAMALDGGPFYVLSLAHAHALSGNRSEALRLVGRMKDLSNQQYVSEVGIAEVYTALGDDDRAFESLEKAFVDRATGLLWLKVDPIFDRLRPKLRFTDLLRRVGLPP